MSKRFKKPLALASVAWQESNVDESLIHYAGDGDRRSYRGRSRYGHDLNARIGRSLLEGMRALTPEALEEAMDDILTRQERERVLARRDLLVEHFDARISRIGDAVLID